MWEGVCVAVWVWVCAKVWEGVWVCGCAGMKERRFGDWILEYENSRERPAADEGTRAPVEASYHLVPGESIPEVIWLDEFLRLTNLKHNVAIEVSTQNLLEGMRRVPVASDDDVSHNMCDCVLGGAPVLKLPFEEIWRENAAAHLTTRERPTPVLNWTFQTRAKPSIYRLKHGTSSTDTGSNLGQGSNTGDAITDNTTENMAADSGLRLEFCEEEILPLPLLMSQEEKIDLYEEFIFFNDDLGDCGLSEVKGRLRVMDTFWYLAVDQTIRVDNAVTRTIEHRVFAKTFDCPEILRTTRLKDIPHSSNIVASNIVSPSTPPPSSAHAMLNENSITNEPMLNEVREEREEVYGTAPSTPESLKRSKEIKPMANKTSKFIAVPTTNIVPPSILFEKNELARFSLS